MPARLVAAACDERETDVVAPGEAAGQRHGVVARATRASRDGRDVERQVEVQGRHSSARQRSRCALRSPAPGPLRRVRRALLCQLGAQDVVGQDGDKAGGDVVDVERVDDARRCGVRCAEIVHARDLAGHHRRDAGAHGLQRREAVPLRQRHVGEGAGPAVELGQDDLGDGAGEDDVIGRPGLLRNGAPAGRPHDHQRPRARQRTAHPAEGPHEPVDVLPRFERADGEEEGARHAHPSQERIGGLGIRRRQMVGSTGHHRDTARPDACGHQVGRHQSGRDHQGGARRAGPPQRRLVPPRAAPGRRFGMPAPRHVVHRDDQSFGAGVPQPGRGQ